ncbi:MAG TPA: heavy metal translocating P-type ATPase, partial [Armatimonadota bacterium]|nr:heavy metal translocating P-type ATPase [Armatimonadota bacterium]
VIACPHALGLAIPLVTALSTTLAARNGFLVRERIALENARLLDEVVFDKTGTLTRGEQGVVSVRTLDGLTEDEALAQAAALEGDSEHMIAAALRREAHERKLKLPESSEFQALPGRGVCGRISGKIACVGGHNLLEQRGIPLPDPLRQAAVEWGQEGKSVVYLLVEDKPCALFALADVIRAESREAVARLRQMGVRVAMLTGDSEDVARWVARELQIDEYFAQVLPAEKADKVRSLKERGARVAMVGDGINDAPALLTADVGIAIGAGTDVAIESAGIILVRNDPRDVARVLTLSRAAYRKMVENLVWATGYNAFAIPLAAGALAAYGIYLAPAFAALLMSLSTVIVAMNAQLLRRLDLRVG